MRNLKEIPPAEIERSLIGEADNDEAWEAPVNVGRSNSRRPEWYKRKETPIGMTLADCGNRVDAHEVYDFITRHTTGVTAYALRPQGVAAAALDFYLVLDAFASITSIASVLWMAYDRFIAPTKRGIDDSAGIYLAVRRQDGEIIHVWLGSEVSTKEDFVERFERVIAEAKSPELRPTHEATLRELQDSDSWIRVDGETNPLSRSR